MKSCPQFPLKPPEAEKIDSIEAFRTLANFTRETPADLMALLLSCGMGEALSEEEDSDTDSLATDQEEGFDIADDWESAEALGYLDGMIITTQPEAMESHVTFSLRKTHGDCDHTECDTDPGLGAHAKVSRRHCFLSPEAAAAGRLKPLLGAGVSASSSASSITTSLVETSHAETHTGMIAERIPWLLAALAAGQVGLRRRRDARRVRRRFFGNLFGPEEIVDPEDPGRPKVCGEYQNMPGSIVASQESEFGWALVSRHDASEEDGFWVGDAPGPVKQEWRELRLASRANVMPMLSEGTGQSVVKVSLCDGELPQQVPYCMTLAYTKTLCAAALSGAHLQGALPLGGPQEFPQMRALVVGLGAGSIPVWLEHTFPKGKVIVDALEIDPAVVEMATEAMGFPKSAMRPAASATDAAADAASGADGQHLRVYSIAGEDFVEALAAKAGEDYRYDLVYIDAFDKKGQVPPVLVESGGAFLKSLSKLLAPK
ncbi:unnamed protein product, partial [Polarella glacialis]